MVETRRTQYKVVASELHTFETLVAAVVRTPQILKPPVLRIFYHLLQRFSSNASVYCYNYGVGSNSMGLNFSQFRFTLEHNAMRDLSNVMFKEFGCRFDKLFSTSTNIPPSRTYGKSSFQLHREAIEEELILLLRCCIVILPLLEFDQSLIMEKCHSLLSLLKQLCGVDTFERKTESIISFRKSYSLECANANISCTASVAEGFTASLCFLEPSEKCLPLVCLMLEVYADELLLHRPLRKYFMLIESVSPANERLSICHPNDFDIGVLPEVISSHFLVSLSDDLSFQSFPNTLFEDDRVPEVSLKATISLLLHPILLSAPKTVMAHLVSLVSKAMGKKPDPKLMDSYLAAFERSVTLHLMHMPSLRTADDKKTVLKSCAYLKNSFPSFESTIQPTTRRKVSLLVASLDNSWHSHIHNMLLRTKSDLVSSSIEYINRRQDILDESCRREVLSLLSCVIAKASEDVGDTSTYKMAEASPQDIFCLATTLNLMSCSLLSALWCLTREGTTRNPEHSEDPPEHREYAFIVERIASFRQFGFCLPIQSLLSDLMGSRSGLEGSKLLLCHFSGLLSLSFASGIEFLVKGCARMLMAALKLLVFEEGNLDSLRPLHCSVPESSTFRPGLDAIRQDETSSRILASKFRKIRSLHFRDARAMDGQAQTSADVADWSNEESLVDKEEETCNGEIYLKCVVEGQTKSSDLDDLADFIQCKPGKDYSQWLKKRWRYRKWKCEKLTVLRWQKKRRVWKSVKGKKKLVSS